MRKRICGIYAIRSIIHPDRIYIGSSTNIRKRWCQHRDSLKNGMHHNSKIMNHYNKYGADDLVFEIIIQCSAELLIAMEQSFINLYEPWFNVRPIADNNFGVKHSEDIIQRNRERRLGTKASEETKRKLSEMRMGHPVSEETKRKIAASNTGKKASLETRKKLSEVHMGLQAGENHPMWGKHPSEESRKKMSESHKGERSYYFGKHLPKEMREKISMNHGRKRGVINIETGIFYDSITAAARSKNMSSDLLHQQMTRDKYRNTPFRFISDYEH